MGCGCRATATVDFVWTAADGTQSIAYPTEIQAKAKVIRSGGSWVATPKAP